MQKELCGVFGQEIYLVVLLKKDQELWGHLLFLIKMGLDNFFRIGFTEKGKSTFNGV
jgi:hypothetical protein